MEVGGEHQVMGMAGYTGIIIRQMGVVTFKRLQGKKSTVKFCCYTFVLSYLMWLIFEQCLNCKP